MHTCEHICPPHACAVMPWGGGGYCTFSLAWDGAVMMPLQRSLWKGGRGGGGKREGRVATVHERGRKYQHD
jgi:hypothetical protein